MDPARQAAIRIIEQLRRHGHEAYLAGGSVRDRLLGLWPKDFDVATSALPQRIRAIHPRARQVGEAFGVLLVKVDRKWIEVATFRKDGDYLDGRRPTNVEFCDAQQDAHRRDFTINGLFEDPLCHALPAGVLESIQPPRTRPDGAPDPTDPGIPLNDPVQMRAIIDHVGGIDDLRHGLVRAIGDPRRRFAEDYLRMLRAVRFAARLGFAIEPVTEAAIGDFANLLGRISRERIGQEVRWMLESAPTSARPIAPDAAGRAARMIQKLRLDAPVFNEDHADPTLATLDGLLAFENASAEPHDPAGPKPPADATLRFSLRLAAWLIDRHRPSADGAAFELSTAINAATPALRRWRRALCLTNLDRDAIRRMFDLLNRALSWSELRCAQRKRLLASPRWEQAFVLLHALGWDARLRRLAERIAEDAPELETDGIGIQPAPLLNGNDLIDSGLKPSPRFKSLLDEAYDLQLEGKLYTRAQARQWLAEQR